MFQIYSNHHKQRTCYDSICSRDKSWSRVSILAWGEACNGPNMTNLNCMFFSANMIIGRRVKIRVILNQILTRRDTQTLCFLTIFNRRSDKYKYHEKYSVDKTNKHSFFTIFDERSVRSSIQQSVLNKTIYNFLRKSK